MTRWLGLVVAVIVLPFIASDREPATATGPAQWRDVSVLDYVAAGATPDGSDIVEALADASRVFVPAGTNLVVTDEITVASGKTLTIDGTLTAAASRPAGWRMLRVHAALDVTIGGRGALMAGSQSNAVYGVWVSGASKRTQIADLAITGFYSGVWSPTDGQWRDDCKVERVTVTGGYVGLNLASWRNGRAADNIVSGQSHVGIGTYNAAGIQVTGGIISGIGYTSTASAAVSVELAPDAAIENIVIKDVEGHAVRVANKSHRARVAGNWMTNVGWAGGVITHGSSSGVAAYIGPTGGESLDLVIAGNTMRTIAGYGIVVHPGLTVSVTGNDLEGIGDPGIAILAKTAIVTGNRVKNADGYGIGLGPDPDGGPYQVELAIVTGNIIEDSGLAGIHGNGSPLNGIVADNIVTGPNGGIVFVTWTWGGQVFVPAPLVTDNVVIP